MMPRKNVITSAIKGTDVEITETANGEDGYRKLLDSTFEPDPKRRRQITPLAGEVPSPFDLGPGCAFASRCPLASERCWTETPILSDNDDGHAVACHHPA